MNEPNPQYGMPRRFLVFGGGLFALIFLAWNIADGVIYFRGDGLNRAEHPVAFWMVAAFLALAALAAIYWAVIESQDSEG